MESKRRGEAKCRGPKESTDSSAESVAGEWVVTNMANVADLESSLRRAMSENDKEVTFKWSPANFRGFIAAVLLGKRCVYIRVQTCFAAPMYIFNTRQRRCTDFINQCHHNQTPNEQVNLVLSLYQHLRRAMLI